MAPLLKIKNNTCLLFTVVDGVVYFQNVLMVHMGSIVRGNVATV